MTKVEIYTTRYCPYCHAAKRLLSRKGVEFTEIDVSGDPKGRSDMVARANGRMTSSRSSARPQRHGHVIVPLAQHLLHSIPTTPVSPHTPLPHAGLDRHHPHGARPAAFRTSREWLTASRRTGRARRVVGVTVDNCMPVPDVDGHSAVPVDLLGLADETGPRSCSTSPSSPESWRAPTRADADGGLVVTGALGQPAGSDSGAVSGHLGRGGVQLPDAITSQSSPESGDPRVCRRRRRRQHTPVHCSTGLHQ